MSKTTFQSKINHYLRKKRKRLGKLKGPLQETPRLIHLATARPVDLIAISERVLHLKSSRDDWLSIIDASIDELEGKEIWFEEAANIFVGTLRAIRSFDTKLAIDFGYRYLSRIDDERSKKTMVNMLITKSDKEAAFEILQSSKNSLWAARKKIEMMGDGIEAKGFESHYLDLLGRNTLEVDFRPAILIYGDVNMNVIDGSSVWLASIAEAFSGLGYDIHVLLKANIERDLLIEDLLDNRDLRIIEPNQFGIVEGQLGVDQAVELIQILDGIQGGYRAVVLRGIDLCSKAVGAKSLHKRLWVYLTDYYSIDPVNGRHIKPGVKVLMPDFSNAIARFLAQTEEIKINLMEEFGIKNSQISLLPPIIPDCEAPSQRTQKTIDVLRIGYCGKIAPMWGVRELIAVAGNLIEQGYYVEVHIIGDKIHSSTATNPNFRERMRKKLQQTEYVTWHGAMTRTAALEFMSTLDVAWCYRQHELESNTLELSTKLLENMAIGLPSIVTRNQIHERLLGEDYPLFVSDLYSLETLLLRIIDTNILSQIDSIELHKKAMGHSFDSIRQNYLAPLLNTIEELPENEVKRILLNGHDLKFIGEFESYLKNKGHIVRRDRWDWGEPSDEERSRALLNWAEVIISEWGLANAVWYSKNLKSGQHHVIRIHLQEINERASCFPPEIMIENVNSIIFVAEHVRETAIEMFDWQEVNTQMIPNYVDIKRYVGEKNNIAGRRLGIVGIVPQRKRLDRALDVLKILRAEDPEWKLIVKGKKPREYSFMHGPGRKSELDYYDGLYKRIEREQHLRNGIIFEGYTTTIASWYQNIGFILSPSDFESFHFSIGEGVASGAVPIIWPWEGATEIYPPSWVVKDTKDAAKRILNASQAADLNADEDANREYILNHFGTEVIFAELMKAMGLE